MDSYKEEAVFIHVSKHLYDVSCTESQFGLNRKNKKDDQKELLHILFILHSS